MPMKTNEDSQRPLPIDVRRSIRFLECLIEQNLWLLSRMILFFCLSLSDKKLHTYLIFLLSHQSLPAHIL